MTGLGLVDDPRPSTGEPAPGQPAAFQVLMGFLADFHAAEREPVRTDAELSGEPGPTLVIEGARPAGADPGSTLATWPPGDRTTPPGDPAPAAATWPSGGATVPAPVAARSDPDRGGRRGVNRLFGRR